MCLSRQQTRRMMENSEAQKPTLIENGYWRSGAKLSFGGVTYPRGCTVPTSAVRSLAPGRLSILMGNKMLDYVLGEPAAKAPAAVIEQPEDPNAVAEKQRAAMVRDGYQDWEMDHRVKAPVGARTVGHPSTAVRPRT